MGDKKFVDGVGRGKESLGQRLTRRIRNVNDMETKQRRNKIEKTRHETTRTETTRHKHETKRGNQHTTRNEADRTEIARTTPTRNDSNAKRNEPTRNEHENETEKRKQCMVVNFYLEYVIGKAGFDTIL